MSTKFISIYPPKEHPPAHVHVWLGKRELAEIYLQPLEVKKIHNTSPKELLKALEIVKANQEYLLERWREHHEHN